MCQIDCCSAYRLETVGFSLDPFKTLAMFWIIKALVVLVHELRNLGLFSFLTLTPLINQSFISYLIYLFGGWGGECTYGKCSELYMRNWSQRGMSWARSGTQPENKFTLSNYLTDFSLLEHLSQEFLQSVRNRAIPSCMRIPEHHSLYESRACSACSCTAALHRTRSVKKVMLFDGTESGLLNPKLLALQAPACTKMEVWVDTKKLTICMLCRDFPKQLLMDTGASRVLSWTILGLSKTVLSSPECTLRDVAHISVWVLQDFVLLFKYRSESFSSLVLLFLFRGIFCHRLQTNAELQTCWYYSEKAMKLH